MGFNEIPKVENSKFYLDLAFSRAKKDALGLRSSKISGTSLDVKKNIELVKLRSASLTLESALNKVLRSFPSIDQTDEFYVKLMECYFSVSDLRKALSTVSWTISKVSGFCREYSMKVKHSKTPGDVSAHVAAFYGRVSSLLKRLKDHLDFLELARRQMRDFPTVKTKAFTVALFGFPNVGKTTLLSKITGSKPEISNYAFTTKNINIGYAKIGEEKVQFLDTPGSLNRFEKMNDIEKQAYLALKHCTHVIVYVIDPTEASYPISDQLKLLESIKEFDKPIIVYLSKTDILNETVKLPKLEFVSDVELLKKKISEEIY